ncbi:methylated-DNA-[protein]-cysteine S-methyltransferase [Scopulibacillus darangshiensis]|uniref:Methylated-DNA--protein-cysteine methyltransferase n=1 Tax=Scopulibacillus darangshiensis TaxID=442528 RepID=A0A4R2NBB0_9BACL|nr:methylated-DNA--[protein]-cysteine S-methyltransferase [Scopulibacillus darangshiensis]TCP18324.1 methylated-DNA-[protein]-cysteine S-methyltransferase [Scopulibacillus darangshiensis]
MVKKPCIYVEEIDSPIGMLTIACHHDGLCSIEFGSLQEAAVPLQSWAKKHMMHNELKKDQDYTGEAARQLTEYFNGERQTFDLPLCLKGTPFQIKVWRALREIGYGETKSYKDIAQAIGNPKAVRAVGSANNSNPLPIVIPCHRVIGSSGSLVGYGGGLDKKVTLLDHEKMIMKS